MHTSQEFGKKHFTGIWDIFWPKKRRIWKLGEICTFSGIDVRETHNLISWDYCFIFHYWLFFISNTIFRCLKNKYVDPRKPTNAYDAREFTYVCRSLFAHVVSMERECLLYKNTVWNIRCTFCLVFKHNSSDYKNLICNRGWTTKLF